MDPEKYLKKITPEATNALFSTMDALYEAQIKPTQKGTRKPNQWAAFQKFSKLESPNKYDQVAVKKYYNEQKNLSIGQQDETFKRFLSEQAESRNKTKPTAPVETIETPVTKSKQIKTTANKPENLYWNKFQETQKDAEKSVTESKNKTKTTVETIKTKLNNKTTTSATAKTKKKPSTKSKTNKTTAKKPVHNMSEEDAEKSDYDRLLKESSHGIYYIYKKGQRGFDTVKQELQKQYSDDSIEDIEVLSVIKAKNGAGTLSVKKYSSKKDRLKVKLGENRYATIKGTGIGDEAIISEEISTSTHKSIIIGTSMVPKINPRET
jgi:hypothetical protein